MFVLKSFVQHKSIFDRLLNTNYDGNLIYNILSEKLNHENSYSLFADLIDYNKLLDQSNFNTFEQLSISELMCYGVDYLYESDDSNKTFLITTVCNEFENDLIIKINTLENKFEILECSYLGYDEELSDTFLKLFNSYEYDKKFSHALAEQKWYFRTLYDYYREFDHKGDKDNILKSFSHEELDILYNADISVVYDEKDDKFENLNKTVFRVTYKSSIIYIEIKSTSSSHGNTPEVVDMQQVSIETTSKTIYTEI